MHGMRVVGVQPVGVGLEQFTLPAILVGDGLARLVETRLIPLRDLWVEILLRQQLNPSGAIHPLQGSAVQYSAECYGAVRCIVLQWSVVHCRLWLSGLVEEKRGFQVQ